MRSQLREKGQMVILVRDSGLRRPTGNVEQILDTFFSTKWQDACLGSGACLIVASNPGRILLASNSGAGATFHFALPAREVART